MRVYYKKLDANIIRAIENGQLDRSQLQKVREDVSGYEKRNICCCSYGYYHERIYDNFNIYAFQYRRSGSYACTYAACIPYSFTGSCIYRMVLLWSYEDPV